MVVRILPGNREFWTSKLWAISRQPPLAGFDMAKTTRLAHSCPMKIVEAVRKSAPEQGLAEEEAL
jgi:hypothetical protein